VFTLGAATRVYLAAGVTDMRKSFNGLYTLVRGALQADPISGHLFVFCNRRRDRLKVLYFDGTGLWVCAKRLERGTFRWPDEKQTGSIELTHAQFSLLLGGIDLCTTRKRRWLQKK